MYRQRLKGELVTRAAWLERFDRLLTTAGVRSGHARDALLSAAVVAYELGRTDEKSRADRALQSDATRARLEAYQDRVRRAIEVETREPC